jgi:methionine sulfoxide reductase heme-binding subunit
MTDPALTDPTQHFFWLASRSLGVIAMLLVSGAVACGLALSGRLSHRPGAAAWLKTAHEALTLTSLGAIAGHGLLLLADPYLHPGLSGITLPFALASQPVWTGLGIIGAWLAAILGLSYYVRRFIGVAAWRWLHRWTLLAYALCLGHSIGSGTDASSPWMLALLGAATLPVIAIGAARLWGALGGRTAPGRPVAQASPSPVRTGV